MLVAQRKKIGGYTALLSRLLYRVLSRLMPICFNTLNVLLLGNLPPLGGTSVIVEDQERFLLIKHSGGVVAFPGGYIRWREHPLQAAQRECREETGLNIALQEAVGTYSHIGTGPMRVSTINIVYAGKIAEGGTLRGSVEGQPVWMTEAEMRKAMDVRYSKLLEDYFAYRARVEGELRR